MAYARQLFEQISRATGLRIHECTDVENVAQTIENKPVILVGMLIQAGAVSSTCHVKTWNAADGLITEGTTEPDGVCLPVAASETYTVIFSTLNEVTGEYEIGLNGVYTSAISVGCSEEKGKDMTTAPQAAAVDIYLLLKDAD